MRSHLMLFLILGSAIMAWTATDSVAAGFADPQGLTLESAKPAPPTKPPGEPYTQPPEGPRVQGDTAGDPFVIPSLPFSATGTTCGFFNDYDAVCPYPGSTAPDVVYRFDPLGPICLQIDLCGSAYDTKVYLCENSIGNVIACNDDYCDFQSFLTGILVSPGETYYIVVDGYDSSCGNYDLTVLGLTCDCFIECPAGALPEGEPDCFDGYVDSYNAGCGAEPSPVFQNLEPSCDPIVICGTTGVYMLGSVTYRDTDWFQLDLTAPSEICLAGDSEVPSLYIIVDGRTGCGNTTVVAYGLCGPCLPVEGICYPCDAGTWWMWAGTSSWDPAFACGSTYVLEITGYTGPSSPSSETTWGRVKGLFR